MGSSDSLGSLLIDSRLATLLLHTTVWLAIASLARFIWAKYPARAHRAMTQMTVAAIISPCAAIGIQILGWGLLPSQRPSLSAYSQMDGFRTESNARPEDGLDVTNDEGRAASMKYNASSLGFSGEQRHASRFNSYMLGGSWHYTLLVMWPIASAMLMLRLLLSFHGCREIVRRATECQIPICNASLNDAIAQLQYGLSPKLVASPCIDTPVIWCWERHPVLLIPSSMADARLGRDAWRMIFCHELAHHLRGDHWSSLWNDLLVILIPWHPLSWYARRQLQLLQELACDDQVLDLNDNQVGYAETLLAAASPFRYQAALPMAHRGRGLRQRIDRILSAGGASPVAGQRWVAGMALFVVAGITAGALAQMPTQESSDAESSVHGNRDKESPIKATEPDVLVAERAPDASAVEPARSERAPTPLEQAGDDANAQPITTKPKDQPTAEHSPVDSALSDNQALLHQIADGYRKNRESFRHGKCRFTYSIRKADSEQDALNGKWNDAYKFTSEFWLYFRDNALTVKPVQEYEALQQRISRGEDIIYPECYARKGQFGIDYDPIVKTSIVYSPANQGLTIRMHPFNLATDADSSPEASIAYAESKKFEGARFAVNRNAALEGRGCWSMEVDAEYNSHRKTYFIDPEQGYLPFVTESFAKDDDRSLAYRMVLLSVHREGGNFFPLHAIQISPQQPRKGQSFIEVREMKVVEFDFRYEPTIEDLSLQLPKDTQLSDGVNPNTAKSLFRDGVPGNVRVSVDDLEGIYNSLQKIAAERARSK